MPDYKKGERMKYILTMLAIIILSASTLAFIMFLRGQLSDCRFECKNLQTRLTRCQELSNCAEALEQTLPSLAWAQVRAINEEIKQKRHWKYEGQELPLLTGRE